jgi:hypothetical protein
VYKRRRKKSLEPAVRVVDEKESLEREHKLQS